MSIEDIKGGNFEAYILSEEQAVAHLPELCVTDKQAVRFCNGGQLAFDRLHIMPPAQGTLFRVKNKGLLLGIGVADTAKEQIAIKAIINYPE